MANPYIRGLGNAAALSGSHYGIVDQGGDAKRVLLSALKTFYLSTLALADITDASANGRSLVAAANYSAMRTLLSLVPGTNFYSVAGADAAFQALDADLTAIAALSPSNDDIVQRKAGAWTNRTAAQYLADLGALGKFPFPATQVPSAGANDLDDYEEGTFTPALTFGGGATGMTFSSQVGEYTKIGNRVLFNVRLVLTAKGSSTGIAAITGMPFTTTAITPYSVLFAAMTSGVGDTQVSGVSSGTTIPVYKQASGTVSQLTEADFSGTAQINVAGNYHV